MDRKLRMGMIGGGDGALVAPAHRIAAAATGMIELAAGAFSNSRPKSKDDGIALGIDPQRAYGIYRDMFRREARLPADERLDFVSIVTPSNMHYPVTMAALDAGFHVLCEAPMATTLDEAENLARKLEQHDKLFCISQHHTGYPMVAEARRIIESGELGKLRKIVVEYPQAWLATRIEARGQKQAAWRTNPRNTGASCCINDVASIAYDLATTMTGLSAIEVCADLATFVNGRMLDDDGSVLLHYPDDIHGLIWASQTAIGEDKSLKIRIYGDQASLCWQLDSPDKLTICTIDGKLQTKSAELPKVSEKPAQPKDIPAGHPDNAVEPLITIYKTFAESVAKIIDGKKIKQEEIALHGIEDGLQTMRFIDAVIANAESEEKWTPLRE